MIKKNSNTLRSRTENKCETKKKIVTDIILAFEVYSFLSTHAVLLLELEQTLKDFLDLKICRILIKLLD